MESRSTTLLIILDGWGYREESSNNAIQHARKPCWDKLWAERPHTLIHTSGLAVGLPDGQMGNSEVGHMNLGAGRILYQSFTKIGKDIDDGTFATLPAIAGAIGKAVAGNKAVHVLGLLSPGGVHSHEDHLIAACRVAAEQGAKEVYIHAFLDGRDTPPQSALPSLQKADKYLQESGVGRVASMVGRYYAMDRDNRWDRVQQAYDLLTRAEAPYTASTVDDALKAAYERGENDEFVKPTWIGSAGAGTIKDGDVVLFMNFRADRSRELTHAFIDKEFSDFARKSVPVLAEFVTLTEYAADIKVPCAYPPEELKNGMGEYMQTLGKTQLRIAETEKYAHVTFFFSGGVESNYKGEDRILIPSPNVATYDLKPEMSAPLVTDKLVEAIESGKYDLIVCNYANGDMVGHTGILEAAVKAVEAVDQCLSRVIAAIEKTGAQCLITADHGNAESMLDDEGRPHTQHTTGPVPLVYVGPQKVRLLPDGKLSDIAPSLLTLMALPQPPDMTGSSLVELIR
jgi:2,3-bisphosphoglycerate-independent phosphoglycerate mutase